ncbi:hypothetical protein [Bifidobacterium sp. ESL0745]|uniref:hypothetical protein n=1 Tax=Bifidobacterium sp. ESL0745 TaxID=2983226 RepID=UPI0023F772E1|nr:hypothetical protein [Bifidobacterium sp. ESL0745]MDF7665932.1 hypothetical protein [Bifidobacterium sp. ESL0745]
MGTYRDVIRVIAQAEAAECCAVPTGRAQRDAMRRRQVSGELVSPYHRIYARAECWRALNPEQQSLYVIRALARVQPTWTFAGVSAAAVLGLDHPWNLHRDGLVWIATSGSVDITGDSHLRRIFVARLETRAVQGVKVTSVARTLVDCALRYSFRDVLPMFDAAFRKYSISEDSVLKVCDTVRADIGPVLRLMYYANAASENGGESLCRAVIIEHGFAIPQLQRVFIDPANRQNEYRADFTWRFADGRVIVLEFDGNEKYINPAMTRMQSTEQVVYEERLRESALRRAGVTDLIRTNYREVLGQAVLVHKLLAAGIPLADSGSRLLES